MKELRQAGLTRADLLAAVTWVCTSSNIKAEGARSTGDPVGTLLRAAHCVTYCELARDGATAPAPKPGARPQAINGYPSAPAFAAHVKGLFGCNGDRPQQLHADPIVNAAGHAAIDACGGWQPLGRLTAYDASRAYAGPFADAYLKHLQTHGGH